MSETTINAANDSIGLDAAIERAQTAGNEVVLECRRKAASVGDLGDSELLRERNYAANDYMSYVKTPPFGAMGQAHMEAIKDLWLALGAEGLRRAREGVRGQGRQ